MQPVECVDVIYFFVLNLHAKRSLIIVQSGTRRKLRIKWAEMHSLVWKAQGKKNAAAII